MVVDCGGLQRPVRSQSGNGRLCEDLDSCLIKVGKETRSPGGDKEQTAAGHGGVRSPSTTLLSSLRAEPPTHHDTSPACLTRRHLLNLAGILLHPHDHRSAPADPLTDARPARVLFPLVTICLYFRHEVPIAPSPPQCRGEIHRTRLSRRRSDAMNQETECHFPLIEREPALPWKSPPDPSYLIVPIPIQACLTLPCSSSSLSCPGHARPPCACLRQTTSRWHLIHRLSAKRQPAARGRSTPFRVNGIKKTSPTRGTLRHAIRFKAA